MNVNYVRFIFFLFIHLFIYEKFTRTESANEPKEWKRTTRYVNLTVRFCTHNLAYCVPYDSVSM